MSFIKSDAILITRQSLLENGYVSLSNEFYENKEKDILVRVCILKTGADYFINAGRSVKNFNQLLSRNDQNISNTEYELSSVKLRALMGDGLISFFSRELICSHLTGLDKYYDIKAASEIVSNKYLDLVCRSLPELKARDEFKNTPQSRGTVYESIVYDIYKEKGFDAAFEFFKNTVYKFYKENGI